MFDFNSLYQQGTAQQKIGGIGLGGIAANGQFGLPPIGSVGGLQGQNLNQLYGQGLGLGNGNQFGLGGLNNPLQQSQQLQQGFNANITGGNNGSGFGFNLGTAQLGLGALQGLSALYLGGKQLGLARDQYNTNTAFANRNLGNQATLLNGQLQDRYQSGRAQAGVSTSDQQLQQYLAARRVDGSPIK